MPGRDGGFWLVVEESIPENPVHGFGQCTGIVEIDFWILLADKPGDYDFLPVYR